MAPATLPVPAFVPLAERRGSGSPSRREIACRRCAGWMRQESDLRWRHVSDGSLACVDPATLTPYPVGPNPKENPMTSTTKNLDEMTTTALRAECKSRSIAYSGNDRKADLIAKLSTAPVDEPEVAATVASTDKIERLRLAQDEHKAMKAWRKAGANGSPPATPNLDAVNEESATAPRTGLGARRARASVAATRPPKAEKVPVTYFRNGEEMPPSKRRFCDIVWYTTANLDGDAPRISSKRLREILAADPYNIADPTTGTWEVTLPNGETIGCRPVV